MRCYIIVFITILLSQTMKSQTYNASWESLDARPIPGWFADAKFGIFIHWGLYSVPAWAPTGGGLGVYDKYAEWYWHRISINPTKDKDLMRLTNLFKEHHKQAWGENFNYQNFAALWKAENFNPDQWADLFKKAGAKYVVLTSKHHEGFTLWSSAQSWNWNSVDIGPQRDLCAELNTAVRKTGIRMGYYYSLYEWFNPLYKSSPSQYVNKIMIPQMKDLVTRYSPDVLWTDGAWEHTDSLWKSKEFLTWLYNESSVKDQIVVNDRWGKDTRGKHGGFYTTEYDLAHNDKALEKTNKVWEECRGIGGSFGYNKNETLDDYMSSEQLVHLLIEKVAHGGNLLLNIGPTADGRIPVIMQQRLMDLGDWLHINGESIYGTRYWNFSKSAIKENNLFFTQKNSDLYIIMTNWPTKKIRVKVQGKVKAVTLLDGKTTVGFKQSAEDITISIPAFHPERIKSRYAWVFKLEGACVELK